jgi:hypothetical protein
MADQQIPPTNQTEPARVNRQIVLPFAKSVEISLKSIKVRFFRSLITTMSLVLAVSFLSFVRISNDVANGLLATQDRHLRQAVIRSGYDLGPEDTNVGASPKQRWIIILSLLVCVVGIVNAQLMAVTERFREIGTMKCLGALDRFILRLFILESRLGGYCDCGGLSLEFDRCPVSSHCGCQNAARRGHACGAVKAATLRVASSSKSLEERFFETLGLRQKKSLERSAPLAK